MYKNLLILLLLLSLSSLNAKEVIVDLKDANYQESVISTSSGGVVTEGCIRIQARCICYTKTTENGLDIEKVTAERDLLVLYGKKLMVGGRLEYDFQKGTGVIYDGLVVEEPWVIGGKELYLESDGSYKIIDGFLTLCDSHENDFAIRAHCIRILKGGMISADNIHFRLFDFTLFSFPELRSHKEALTDLPFQVKFTLGGIEGSYATIRYRAVTLENFRAFLRADYVLGRGPGGGIDWDYCDKKIGRVYHAKNFGVRDRSYDDPSNRFRYRFEGHYKESFCCDKVNARLVYDVLSDTEMASDFSAKEFDLKTGQRTELTINRREDCWIGDFITRVRVNDFQTINQELPSARLDIKPISIGQTGIVSDTRISAAYLNYVFASGTPNISDFDSSRVEINQSLYRPFHIGCGGTLTPEVGGTLIHYGNDNDNNSALQAIGYWGFLANTHFYRLFSCYKHIVEPYLQYQNFTSPTVFQSNVPIFSIQDGYSRLQLVRLGITNSLFAKEGTCLSRPFFIDLWTYAFYSINTMEKRIPRIYTAISWNPFTTLACRYEAGFNRETNSIDLFNLYHLWTVNQDFALGFDLLSRGPRYWRKADLTNFMLDGFRSETELENSLLSDRRNTFLAHFFYRFHPNWNLEAQSRLGWHRQFQPSYFEYKVDLSTVVGCNWILKLGYEHREIDNRFFISFRLGKQRPGE